MYTDVKTAAVCEMTLAAVLGQLLLLFCACINGQTTDEYAIRGRLDYCGQSCPSSCEEAEDEDAVCRCDSECERYGDCCSPSSGRLNCTGGEQRAQPLAGLQCRSIHLDSRTQPRRMEAFWMVSACPEDWPANQDDEILREVDEKCSNGSDTLPPVTDLDGGVVYKNEYCAVCHQVTNVQTWGYRFGCSPCFWERFITQGMNVTREKLILEECIPCGFYVPETRPPPRDCLHDSLVVSECLAREVLEERTGLRWEEEVYRDIVTQCRSGPVRPAAAKNLCNEPPTYRNQHCAICNALKTANLRCVSPYNNPDSTRDFCLVDAELCDDVKSGSIISPEPDTIGINTTGDSPTMRRAVPSDHDPQTSGSGMTTETDHTTYPIPESHDNSGSGETSTEPEVIQPVVCGVGVQLVHTSFSMFFDVTADSEVIPSAFTTVCSKGQVFDPINQVCRQTVCTEVFGNFKVPCTTLQRAPPFEIHNISNDSLMLCDEGLIVLHESEFELLDNSTLLFRNDTFEIVGHNGSLPIICSNLTQNGTVSQYVTVFYYSYPPTLSVLTYVCCSLSVVGCVAVLLTYSLFKELRTLPGQILMNLASTILATCLFLLVGIPIAVVAEKDELCETTAILLHLVMLSQFSWMSIMSFELLRTLYRASRLQPVEDKSTKDKIFILYFSIGWGIPILILMVSLPVNFTTDMIQYGRDGFCWIGHVPSFYVVFLVPVALSIVFNGITFVLTFCLLYKASRDQAKLKKEQKISYLRIYLCVFSITGLTWIFGFLAILIGDDWAWYVFVILSSTQGMVICAAFIFTQKVAGLYKNLLTLSFYQMTFLKNKSKERTQESSLQGDISSMQSPKSASDQEYVKTCAVAVQNIKEKESCDHVPIKMDI